MKAGVQNISLRLISDQKHNSQIVTGFLMLGDDYCVELKNEIQHNPKGQYQIPHIVECEYHGKKIAYDTSDGYFDGIEKWVPKYDFYFKRSYAQEQNLQLFGDNLSKHVFPLGLNYFVTCPGNPYGVSPRSLETYIRMLLGRKENSYFTPDRFEAKNYDGQGVIFFTRLWKPEAHLSKEVNAQREKISILRIELLRKLKEELDSKFVGGLYPGSYEREMAPDLLIPKGMTRREKYLQLMHSCSIAIGSTGLHDSIGWKTGEYVAAGKAIVNERFCYEVPGEFAEGQNYLAFSSVEECLQRVKYLLAHPEETARMQCRNKQYYDMYLAPNKLIERTLRIIDENRL